MAGETMTPSRNAPCPCGSGKKYKKCCLTSKTENDVLKPATAAVTLGEPDLDELSNRANDLIRERQWEAAERLCQRLREQFPEELDADDRLAQLHQAQGHYPQALTYAQAALAMARRRPEKFDLELVADLEEQVAFIESKAVP
jgi:tetratricopeptide (TPR) repeat protein